MTARATSVSDPKPRRNGTCAVCGRKRPPAAVAGRDPFDRTECARKFHGAELTLPKTGRGRPGLHAEVSEMTSQGLSRDDIARKLGVTPGNVTRVRKEIRDREAVPA